MGHFHIGVGGYCQHDLQDPIAGPTGYWCAMEPPRGQCWDRKANRGSGCTQTHMSPDGVVFARALNYTSVAGMEVHAWRGGGRWFTQRWNVSHLVRANATLIFDRRTGGQGGEGMTSAGQWWVEVRVRARARARVRVSARVRVRARTRARVRVSVRTQLDPTPSQVGGECARGV